MHGFWAYTFHFRQFIVNEMEWIGQVFYHVSREDRLKWHEIGARIVGAVNEFTVDFARCIET